MSMPRCIRVIEYYSVPIDGRGFGRPDIRERYVYLDTHEVEILTVPKTTTGEYTVRMKSGRELSVGEDDFNRIERAMRERE